MLHCCFQSAPISAVNRAVKPKIWLITRSAARKGFFIFSLNKKLQRMLNCLINFLSDTRTIRFAFREKKWVTVKDTTMKLYKWVPAANQTVTSPAAKKMFGRGAAPVKKPPRPYQVPEENRFSLGMDPANSEVSQEANSQSQMSGFSEAFKKGTNGTPQTASSVVDSESLANEDSNLSFPNPESNTCSLPAEGNWDVSSHEASQDARCKSF